MASLELFFVLIAPVLGVILAACLLAIFSLGTEIGFLLTVLGLRDRVGRHMACRLPART